MKYFKNRQFARDLKESGLNHSDVEKMLDDIFEGRAQFLGLKIYKVRVASKRRGKSASFRSVFFWKRNEFIVFCLLFAKNVQDNLKLNEKKVLRILAKEYDRLTPAEVKELIHNKIFMEIHYVQK